MCRWRAEKSANVRNLIKRDQRFWLICCTTERKYMAEDKICDDYVRSHHPPTGQTLYSNMARDYSPWVPDLEHLQYKIHGGAIQGQNNAIITNACLNDPFLSCPCKVHIDFLFFFPDGWKLLKWANQYVYLYP